MSYFKVPLVVHNGLHDVVYLYSSLISPLPKRWAEFVARLPVHFPGGIYDTKYLVQKLKCNASFLSYVFAKSDRDRQDRFMVSTEAKPYFEVIVNRSIYGKKDPLATEETGTIDNNRKRKLSPELL